MPFGEAFINGLLMAPAVTLRPLFVMSFNERMYFSKRQYHLIPAFTGESCTDRRIRPGRTQ